jgi:hypothetical protein
MGIHPSDVPILNNAIRALNTLARLDVPRAVTGTVAISNGGSTITGTGTNFDPEVAVGDKVVFYSDGGADERTVYTIASRSSDTVAAINGTYTGRTITAGKMRVLKGLGDSDISGLSDPGTVSGLVSAIDAFSIHASDEHLRDMAVSALKLAAEPMFALNAPTIGTVTTATSGGALTNGTYYYRVVAVDRNGKIGPASSEGSVTATGTNQSINTIPWTEPTSTGGFTYRVYRGTTTGVYTRYQDVTDAATVNDTGSNFTTVVSETTATLAAAAVAGYGLLTEDMVDDARDAGSANFTTLRNAVADQHPLGTTARTMAEPVTAPFTA